MRRTGHMWRLAGVLLAIAAPTAVAQIVRASGLSPFVRDYRVDFAIPDAPAFKLLQTDESAILRPQTVRDLSFALDGFRGRNNTFVVPKQFAVEFSPGLLIGGRTLRISDYSLRKYLYATRLSAATARDSLNRAQLAAGVRFTLVDEQDLRSRGANGTDTAVTRLTNRMLEIHQAARDRVGPRGALVLTDADREQIAALSDSVKQYWADAYWNANSLELAFGGRARTSDSLGNDPTMAEVSGWATYANGLRGWGQVLLGAKVGAARDSVGDFRSSSTLAVRLYIGSNDLKAFVEGQQAVASKADAQWLLNSGVEVRLPAVGWVNASAGYATTPFGGKGRVVSSFKFKGGAPGL